MDLVLWDQTVRCHQDVDEGSRRLEYNAPWVGVRPSKVLFHKIEFPRCPKFDNLRVLRNQLSVGGRTPESGRNGSKGENRIRINDENRIRKKGENRIREKIGIEERGKVLHQTFNKRIPS